MRTRSEYRLKLGLGDSAPWEWPDSHVRSPAQADRDAVAALLLDAYRGTIDDEGEDESDALKAAEHYLATSHHPYSLLAVRSEAVIAMSFVVVVKERHYVDPVATAANFKGMRLGRSVVCQSLSLLASDGIEEVGAVITDGNLPSERLFTSLGFSRVGAWG